MNREKTDVVIIGAGPVGLFCAYLGHLSGLQTVIIDKSDGPLQKGRADALNARTLQLLEIVGLFDELYPMGKSCNTSSVWANGKFISRQSSWWEALQGCFHKHFLMLGQSNIEKLLDQKLKQSGVRIIRSMTVENIALQPSNCLTSLSNGEQIESSYVIGADGAQSFVRNHFKIPFDIIRPQLTWAVIDGIIDTDFPKVPEIIVFQAETSDVAWIPREGEIDRFYVRMDKKTFSLEEVMEKINRAMSPHHLKFKAIDWFSQFSVKESVAEKFYVHDRIFLAGDACHIHSVNGGQGLNTGIADAFNLMWKLSQVIKHAAPKQLLESYENERRPVAVSVIETSGELVRSTKYSQNQTHAEDYVKIVEKHAGNITGMGIRYGSEGLAGIKLNPFSSPTSRGVDRFIDPADKPRDVDSLNLTAVSEGLAGSRLFDFEIHKGPSTTRIYSLLDYASFTLLIFSDDEINFEFPESLKTIKIKTKKDRENFWSQNTHYNNQAILVRPDGYIQNSGLISKIQLTDSFLKPASQ